MFLKDLLGQHKATVKLPTALATAATVDIVTLFRAPFNLTVTAVRYLPNVDLTGVTATEATLDVMNRGADGTEVDTIAVDSFDDDLDAVAFVPLTIPLTATVALRDVDEGHVIAIEKSVTSTGLAIDGSIEIEFESRGV